MIVKRYLLQMVLLAAIGTALSEALPRSARSISSAHGRSLIKRHEPEPEETSPSNCSETTPPAQRPARPTTCFYEGREYQDGEYIDKGPCYFTQCEGGSLLTGDTFCETSNQCNASWEPNACCPPCEASPTPEEIADSTKPQENTTQD